MIYIFITILLPLLYHNPFNLLLIGANFVQPGVRPGPQASSNYNGHTTLQTPIEQLRATVMSVGAVGKIPIY